MNARVPPYYDSLSDSDGKVSKIWLNYFQSLGQSSGGAVNSVSGVSGQITITGTAADPIVGISASYPGPIIPTSHILGRISGGSGPSEALTAAQTKTLLALDNVENTALSTWAGSSNLTHTGTITIGVWNGSIIDPAYLPSGFAGLANPTAQIGLTAVNGTSANAIRSDGAPALSQAITPTWSGTHTFTLAPIVSALTASLPVFSDGSKHLVSNAVTGTVNVVMSDSPTFTGTILANSATFFGTLTGTLTGSITGNAATATALQTARAINGVNFDGTAPITITAAAGTLTGATLASNVLASSLTSVGTLAALTVTATITGSVSGNAATATALQTPRAINGVNFDGTGAITVTAAAGTLTGATLASNVLASSLTSVGTLAALTVTATISGSINGNAATATALQTARTINGTSFDGTSNITVTAAAGTLTGATLASNVLASSLTSVGTLGALTVTATINGSVSGNAATVTTNANLTGPIASVGNATSVASQTGTGSTFAMSAGPTFTGTLNAATITASGPVTGSNLSGTNTGDQTSVSGNAGTATALQTPRAINGVNFDGTAAITVTAAASTLTGTTLASNVLASSLTSVGTLATLTVTATITGAVSGNAGTATALQTARTINGTSFDGTGNITVAAAASTLTGTTLASGVTASSLTSVGTLATLTVTATIAGSVNGNAATVTTNANLTGPITSSGNATAIASQTGTGTTFAMSAGPTFTGTVSAAALTLSGIFTGAADWVFSAADHSIRSNTSDGSDNARLNLCGGGAGGNSRGARIQIAGNENADNGSITFSTGAATGGIFDFLMNDNQAAAFKLRESTNVYISCDTTNGSELINVNKDVALNANLKVITAGNGIFIKEGTNAYMGVATLVSGTKTVSTTRVTANSRIFLGVESLGTITSPVAVSVTARSAGTSFTITSANLTDTSVISWLIVEPA